MARGFDSKFVEHQQESGLDRPSPGHELSEAAVLLKRRTLELSRASVVQQMQVATAEGHREMLRRALADLDQQLQGLR